MKKLSVALMLALVLPLFFYAKPAEAAFDKNRLASDSIFSQRTSMSAGSIDRFLNKFNRSCISKESGFSARKPVGYNPSDGFTYGSYVSAGEVIKAAANAYNINPRVLIVTLEKEQSLVTGRYNSTYCDNSTHKYASAMGYGCPDSDNRYNYSGISIYKRNGKVYKSVKGSCVNHEKAVGFTQQVIRGAWLLKFGQQRSLGNTGWAIIKGNWDNSDDPDTYYGGPMTRGTLKRCSSCDPIFYDGKKTIDGESVTMKTGATAALYWYTPHFHGNELFVDIFKEWFGPTTGGPYEARNTYRSGHITIETGQNSSVLTIRFQNVGYKTWYDRAGIKLYNREGKDRPIFLDTNKPFQRASKLAFKWGKCDCRVTRYFSHAYKSDGSPKSDGRWQHKVLPGEYAEFKIRIKAGPSDGKGVFREYFKPSLYKHGGGAFPRPNKSFFDIRVI